MTYNNSEVPTEDQIEAAWQLWFRTQDEGDLVEAQRLRALRPTGMRFTVASSGPGRVRS